MILNRFTGKLSGLLAMILLSNWAVAQKTVSEGTLTYKISTQSDKTQSDPLSGATTVVYFKGNLSRTDMTSPLGKETTIYDSKQVQV